MYVLLIRRIRSEQLILKPLKRQMICQILEIVSYMFPPLTVFMACFARQKQANKKENEKEKNQFAGKVYLVCHSWFEN